MTYDYSWANGPPGSIAPQRWVDRVASYAVSQIPPSKVLLGLAFYGYDWNTTVGGEARALLYPQAEALARQYGTEITTDQVTLSATFSYTEKAGTSCAPMPGVPPSRTTSSFEPRKCAIPASIQAYRANSDPSLRRLPSDRRRLCRLRSTWSGWKMREAPQPDSRSPADMGLVGLEPGGWARKT